MVEKAQQVFLLLDEIEFMFQEPEKQQFLLDDIIIYTNPAFSPNIISALSSTFNQPKAANALQIFNIQPDTDTNKLITHSNNIVVLDILPEHHPLTAGIQKTILGKSQSYVMFAPHFPYLNEKQVNISIKDLCNVPLAISKNSFEFQTTLLNLLAQYGKPNIRVVAPDNNSVAAAIQSGIAANFSNKFFFNSTDQILNYLSIRNAPTFELALIYNENMNPSIITLLSDLLTPLLY